MEGCAMLCYLWIPVVIGILLSGLLALLLTRMWEYVKESVCIALSQEMHGCVQCPHMCVHRLLVWWGMHKGYCVV